MAAHSHIRHMEVALPILTALSFVFVALRGFTKIRYRRPFAWDDYNLGLAWFLLLVSFILLMAAIPFGYGKHIFDIEPKRVVLIARLVASSEAFALLAVAVGQTSVGLTLLRVAERGRTRWERVLIWFLIVTVNLFNTAAAIFLWVTIWKGLLVKKCMEGARIWAFPSVAAGWSVMADLAFVALPWIIMWDSQMRRAKKIGVAVGMSLGFVSAITAAIKIGLIDCDDFNLDITYNSVPLVIWTFAEPAVIIMAASVPSIRLFIEQVFSNRTTRHGLPNGNGLEGNSASSRLPSFASSIFSGGHSDRRTYITIIAGGPIDTSIPLQPLSPGVIHRTCEIQIGSRVDINGHVQ